MNNVTMDPVTALGVVAGAVQIGDVGLRSLIGIVKLLEGPQKDSRTNERATTGCGQIHTERH